MNGLEPRKFAPPEHMIHLYNKALDVIAMLVNRGEIGSKHNDELYLLLSEEVGMTDDEIRTAGFDCLPDEDYRYEVLNETGGILDGGDGYVCLETAIEHALKKGGDTVHKVWFSLDKDGNIDYEAGIISDEIVWEKSNCEACCYHANCINPNKRKVNGGEHCDDFKREKSIYTVKVEQTLEGFVEIEADSEEDALRRANDLYIAQGLELPQMDDCCGPLRFQICR
jgi:hypothetical protein